MNTKHNTISFCTNDYKQYYDYLHDYEINYEAMWDDIKEFLRIAVKNGYQMKMWSDELTVVIEYNYSDAALGGVTLEWLDEDEYIGSWKENEKEDEDESISES